MAGQCQIESCPDNFFDFDGDPLNGCEYECTPTNSSVEACDGQDNDCDGRIDEEVSTVGEPCTVPGVQGDCSQGVKVCLNGQIACPQASLPSEELCDDADNDCDGRTDERVTADACSVAGEEGICAEGVQTCNAGAFTCEPLTAAVDEGSDNCDGKDSDCDGTVDEDGQFWGAM